MNFYVGQRLTIDSYNCTLRFMGDIEGTSGQWLGVEWDDVTRGKHDGKYQGKRYFSCSSESDSAASFIRPARARDLSLSFLQALQKKYVVGNSVEEISKMQNIYFNGKIAEMVGFDKIYSQMSALHELQVVILENLCIRGVQSSPYFVVGTSTSWGSSIKEVSTVCPKIRELDLSRNLIEDIRDVEGICSALHSLERLNISQNRFRLVAGKLGLAGIKIECPFQQITDLQADNTLLSWSDLTTLTQSFPKLQALSFAANELSSLSSPLPTNITALDLSYNNFRSLAAVASLAQMPSLRKLSLRGCPLTSFSSSQETVFQYLRDIDISKTGLTMKDLCGMEKNFPRIAILRCPIPNENDMLMIIARHAGLEMLNSSSVTSQIRDNAELFYLSTVAKEIGDAPAYSEPEILSRHPRWKQLCEMHGEPPISRKEAISRRDSHTVGARLINLICRDARASPSDQESNFGRDEFQLKLPNSLNMCRVYMHVAQKLQTLPVHLSIVWETEEWDPTSKLRSTQKSKKRDHEKSSGQSSRIDDVSGVVHVGLHWKGNGENSLTSHHSDDELTNSSEDEKPGTGVEKATEVGHRDVHGWIRREMYLAPDSRRLGFWIEVGEARLRVEER